MTDREKTVETARALAQAAATRGGRVYYVGGCVRDRLLGIESKDIDVEVHGLAPDVLEELLNSMGTPMEFGSSFGIYALRGVKLDIALPRRERVTGAGHRDFDVSVDPFIGEKAAARRRDFTCNALMEDVLTGEVLDFFGGRADLEAKLLRHVDGDSFPEDPLRVLRCARFAAKLGFTPAPETIDLCSGMELGALSRERVMGELQNALLGAKRPSVFFRTLREMGQLSLWFPEAQALIGTPQSPRHHPEGDVWEHTMLVLDAAAKLRDEAAQPRGFMLAALCHDFGKPLCTVITEEGRIRAYGHDVQGARPASDFLRRLTDETRLIDYVLNMTELHMRPIILFLDDVPEKTTNRLFQRSVEPGDLLLLSMADGGGKGTGPVPEDQVAFLRRRLELYREASARPGVTGADLIAAGVSPGEGMGELIKAARDMALCGISRDSALRQTLALARQRGLL